MLSRNCLLLLLLATFLIYAECYRHESISDDDDEDDINNNDDDIDEAVNSENGFRWLGLGVLSNMQQFFDNIKDNLDALETLQPDENDSLFTNSPQLASSSERQKERSHRPAASAAYLHALRNHHPSYKIRNFVESPEPVSYRGTNRYDPSLMWTGLGRRKR
ncbi:uncharacterized protein LOC142321029 isoform X2 [Lycorma delicatula]|uniref:uncharacterized protein LOC142321029 isoform X2 n=1 Tax=Lycorma delicatula TaxID=130591 RepID=UPI003F51770B